MLEAYRIYPNNPFKKILVTRHFSGLLQVFPKNR